MKRVTKIKLHFYFLIILFCNSELSAQKLFDKDISLNKDQLINFIKVMGDVCKSNNFFFNIENHKSYPSFGKKEHWQIVCEKIDKIDNKKNLIQFINNNFEIKQPHKSAGLLTGYYEPTINVSKEKTAIFRFPILKKNNIYIGRSREYIQNHFELKDVLTWTDDIIDLFFLQIQGSGIGKFSDGTTIKIVYDGNNKLPYSSIGKFLINKGYLKSKNTNLFSIKNWLRQNKKLSRNVMNSNKRYIFFKSLKSQNSQPRGAFGTQLSPNSSIAVDKKIYPLGIPFIIYSVSDETYFPVVSLDTGSAIIGPNRADIFTGRDNKAEEKAGNLKKKIYLLALIPYSK